MRTYYLVSLFGGIFNAAYTIQATDYDSMAQKSLAYFKELYSDPHTAFDFDMCMFDGSIYLLSDNNTWVMDEEADLPPDKFEIIVFVSGSITEIGSTNEATRTILQFNFETGDASCKYYQVYIIVESQNTPLTQDVLYTLEDSIMSYLDSTAADDDPEYEDTVKDIMRESGLAWSFVATVIPESHKIYSFWV